jgi:hypothetical protein
LVSSGGRHNQRAKVDKQRPVREAMGGAGGAQRRVHHRPDRLHTQAQMTPTISFMPSTTA